MAPSAEPMVPRTSPIQRLPTPVPLTDEDHRRFLQSTLQDERIHSDRKGAILQNYLRHCPDAVTLLTENADVFFELLPFLGEELINALSVGQLHNAMSFFILSSPVAKVTPEKIERWTMVENLLSEENKNSLARHLIDYLDTENCAPYIALVQAPSIQRILAEYIITSYITDMDRDYSQWNHRLFLEAFVESLDPFPDEAPFLHMLFSVAAEQGDQAWTEEVIKSRFDRYSLVTAGRLLLNMPQDEKYELRASILEAVQTNMPFIASLVDVIFSQTSDCKTRAIAVALAVQSDDSEGAKNLLSLLIAQKSPALLYIHAVLLHEEGDTSYIDFLFSSFAEPVFFLSWAGEAKDKEFIINFLAEEEARSSVILEFGFTVSAPPATLFNISGSSSSSAHGAVAQNSQEKWSLQNFHENYQGATMEALEQVADRIQRIPPFIIAFGMTSAPYQDWLPTLMPLYTDEQIEACCLFLPDEDLTSRLSEYLDNYPSQTLTRILECVQEGAESFLTAHHRELSAQYSHLFIRGSAWKAAHSEYLKGRAEDKRALYAWILEEGGALLAELRKFNTHKLRNYFLEHPGAGAIDFRQMTENQMWVSKEIGLLKSRPENIAQNEMEDPEAVENLFSEGYLMLLTPLVLGCLQVRDIGALAAAGIRSDSDFQALGLSADRQEKLNQLQGIIEKLQNNQADGQQVKLNQLLTEDCIVDIDRGQRLEESFVKGLNIVPTRQEDREILDEVLNFMWDNFPEEASAIARLRRHLAAPLEGRAYARRFMSALRYSVKFVRTNQTAYVLYHHKRWVESESTSQRMSFE